MGFSWSSYVAQEVLLQTCALSGLPNTAVLACDSPTPLSFGKVYAAATDDADAEGEVAYMQSHMDAIEAALSDAVRAAAASMPESDRALSFMAAQIRNYKHGTV